VCVSPICKKFRESKLQSFAANGTWALPPTAATPHRATRVNEENATMDGDGDYDGGEGCVH
jgi:hypothetical protein